MYPNSVFDNKSRKFENYLKDNGTEYTTVKQACRYKLYLFTNIKCGLMINYNEFAQNKYYYSPVIYLDNKRIEYGPLSEYFDNIFNYLFFKFSLPKQMPKKHMHENYSVEKSIERSIEKGNDFTCHFRLSYFMLAKYVQFIDQYYKILLFLPELLINDDVCNYTKNTLLPQYYITNYFDVQ